MKLLEQLQSPKLWSVIIGLLVSAGLIQFSDSQAGEVAGSLAALFTAVGTIVLAVLSQKGDNDANVEVARQVSLGPVREISLSEPRSVLVESDVAGRLTEMNNEIYGIQQRLNDLARLDERVTKSNNDLYNLRSRVLELEQARTIRREVARMEERVAESAPSRDSGQALRQAAG